MIFIADWSCYGVVLIAEIQCSFSDKTTRGKSEKGAHQHIEIHCSRMDDLSSGLVFLWSDLNGGNL